jgi:hypothetical protein
MRRKDHQAMIKLHLISAAIVAYSLMAAAWICQAELLPLL